MANNVGNRKPGRAAAVSTAREASAGQSENVSGSGEEMAAEKMKPARAAAAQTAGEASAVQDANVFGSGKEAAAGSEKVSNPGKENAAGEAKSARIRAKTRKTGLSGRFDELRGWKLADLIVFCVLALVSFFCFQQRDLMHTVGCSVGYLNGHFADFYDYCGQYGIHPSYMPSVYLLFAIWNIPMKAAGLLTVPMEEGLPTAAVLWAKALPCIIYLLSGKLIYKICLEIGMGEKKSHLCAYASLTMPVAFFDQFTFGQYDIFMTACVLAGLYCWLKKENLKFVLWFALAITFKYTALVLFLPLLLLREKKIYKILISLVLLMSLFAVEYLLYRHSAGFLNYTFGVGSSGDNPTGYIFNLTYFTGFQLSGRTINVSVVVLAYGAVLGWSYFTNPANGAEEARWAFYFSCLALFVLFGLSKWHPQWLMLAVPFWTISAFMTKNPKIYMAVDLLFMIFFVMFNAQTIPQNVDQSMINNGVLAGLVDGDIGTRVMMKDFMDQLSEDMLLSLITMIMLVYAVFKHPKFMSEDPAELQEPRVCAGWVQARFVLGVCFFIIPAFWCLHESITGPQPGYEVTYEDTDTAVLLDETGDTVSQTMISDGTTLDQLQFPVLVNGRMNDGVIKLTLLDGTGTVIFEQDWETLNMVDGDLINAYLGGIPTESGEKITAEISVTQADEDFTVSIPATTASVTSGSTARSGEKAKINGKTEDDLRIAMTLYQY